MTVTQIAAANNSLSGLKNMKYDPRGLRAILGGGRGRKRNGGVHLSCMLPGKLKDHPGPRRIVTNNTHALSTWDLPFVIKYLFSTCNKVLEKITITFHIL